MRGANTDKKKLLIVLLIGVLFGGVFLASPYIGGWEINLSADRMVLDGESFNIAGLKTVTIESDRDFITGDPSDDSNNTFSKPGVTVEHSAAFYVAPSGDTWVEDDEVYIVDTYDVNFTDEHFVRYTQYAIAYDVTIKTDAGEYYKQPPIPFVQWGYLDYGWYYEDKAVATDVFTTFAINPWVASGQDGNWNVIDGWSGIMSAQVGEKEAGLIETGAEEDRGHIIQNLNSKGSQLNMYVSGIAEDDYAFDNPDGLVGVPSAVQIETTGTLGAGAKLELDAANHVWDIAVRNVYVKYRVIVHVLTTLEYEFILGSQGGMDKPTESNTAYMPKIGLLEILGGEYGDLFQMIALFLILVLVLWFGLKFLGIVGTAQKVRRGRG